MGGIETHEGPAAYRDAIEFLKVQPSVPALKWSSAMQKAAKDHIDDIGTKGQTSSLGSGKNISYSHQNFVNRWIPSYRQTCKIL